MTGTLWTELMDGAFSLRFVEAHGVRTRVIEAGAGTPLILLHGTGGHAEAYGRNLARLAQHFRVVAYDMVGHGFSGGRDEPYTLDTYAEQLRALMDELGIDRAHLSGESLGGWVAAWFAAREPERVRRLVLTTPGNVTSKPETMAKIRESTLKAVTEASVESVRSRLEWLFAPGNRAMVTDELVAIRHAIYTRPGAEANIRRVLALQEPDVRARYAWDEAWCSRVTAPTLIMWTSDDPTGDLDEGELLNGWIPESRLVVVDGAGHWPQWERPLEFEQHHLAFLAE